MTATRGSVWALAAALFGFACQPAAAEFAAFGTTLAYLDRDVTPSKVTCYLTNFGGKPIRVKELKIFGSSGAPLAISANTCGSLAGFEVAPRSTCYIGATPPQFQRGHGCAAMVEGGGTLRGELELRDGGARALKSQELTLAAGGTSPSEFRTIASPPMFGSALQSFATCIVTNLGTTTARLKTLKFTLADGSTVDPPVRNCTASGDEFTISPGGTCLATATGIAGTVQCRVQVTRRANIRGALGIGEPNTDIRNFLTLQ